MYLCVAVVCLLRLYVMSQAGPALKRQSSGDSGGLGHPHPSLSRGASLDSPKVRVCDTSSLVIFGIFRADTAAEVLSTRRAAVLFCLPQSQLPGQCPESRFPTTRFPGSMFPEAGFPGSMYLETRFLGSCSPETCGMPWIRISLLNRLDFSYKESMFS